MSRTHGPYNLGSHEDALYKHIGALQTERLAIIREIRTTLGNPRSISKKLRFQVLHRDRFTCQYCGAKAPDVALEVDHIVPVAKGGTREASNLRTACQGCNGGKRETILPGEVPAHGSALFRLFEVEEAIRLARVEWATTFGSDYLQCLDMMLAIDREVPGSPEHDRAHVAFMAYLEAACDE